LTVALTGTLTPDDIAPETMQTLLAAFRRATADPD
jgi:hypothetical protein